MNPLSSRTLAALLVGWRDAGGAAAYRSIADRIRLLVLDGRVSLGTRLPAERDLAAQLKVSRTTVSAAYAELRDRGYLDSLRGSGSVARLPRRARAGDVSQSSELLDFSKATMSAVPAVAAAAERAVARLPAYLGESGFDPVGLPVLRQAIADRYTARGLPTDVDQVMITVGAQNAIALLCRTLLARGDRALVESPSYPHAFEALRAAGGRLVPVSVTTGEGWDEPGLEQALQRTSPSIGYLMPDFHNPTGRTMDARLRHRILELASRQGTTLIADETMAELAIDGQPLEKPFAACGTAVTVGSVGKSVWGGLRIGWIRAERELIQRAARVRFASDLGTPVLDQLVVAELLPEYDAILESRRQLLRAGRDYLVARLRERLPEWEVPHVGGGLTAWVNLGIPVSSQLAIAARNEGLVIAAGPRFGIDGVFERFLRIPFSYSVEETDRAVDALAASWAVVARAPHVDSDEYLSQVV